MVLQFLWESRTLPGLIIFLVNTDIFVRVGADGQAYGLLFVGTPSGRSRTLPPFGDYLCSLSLTINVAGLIIFW